eukprot:18606-Heterococcus_DN1.PRE.4
MRSSRAHSPTASSNYKFTVAPLQNTMQCLLCYRKVKSVVDADASTTGHEQHVSDKLVIAAAQYYVRTL